MLLDVPTVRDNYHCKKASDIFLHWEIALPFYKKRLVF